MEIEPTNAVKKFASENQVEPKNDEGLRNSFAKFMLQVSESMRTGGLSSLTNLRPVNSVDAQARIDSQPKANDLQPDWNWPKWPPQS